jgi:hypothetical protein
MVERMSAYHCDKLCSGTCCAPLRWALNCEYDDLPSCGCESALCQAQLAVDDPAKLAELGAMALRARGIDAIAVQANAENAAKVNAANPDFAIVWAKNGVFLTAWKFDWRTESASDIRALLARIMATPADESSREQCEGLIRGES